MNIHRILSCILLPAYLSSCTTWEVQRASPEQVVTEDQPSKIQVTTTDQSELVVEKPRVSGDTLLGIGDWYVSLTGSVYAVSDTGSALEIPLADISHVALKKTDATKSVLFGLGIVAMMVAAAGLACAAGGCRSVSGFSIQ